MNTYIQPNWPANTCIRAYTTLRHIDVSNKAPERNLIQQTLNTPSEPIWIDQKHTDIVLKATDDNRDKIADATFTTEVNQVCLIFTADCIPLLLCHRKGTLVAAIHAGWRGLAKGIIKATLSAINLDPKDLLVWIGPAITQPYYEVGEEVLDQMVAADPECAQAFKSTSQRHWLCDLYAITKLQLRKQGVTHIYGADYCTYSQPDKFFSYRRDGGHIGRMASLIWISDSS